MGLLPVTEALIPSILSKDVCIGVSSSFQLAELDYSASAHRT